MFAGLQGWQLVIIVLLVVLLFGAPKLPSMARNLGQSMRIFSSEVKQMRTEDRTKATGATGTEGGSHAATTEPVEGRVVEPEARPRDER
ncbi:Sec-independent protein translocase subunit TatA [Micrococcus sp.]|uniref:Sec-independent protein translocase subunit TatA n=1 Tax=Micrococcus sp. TaxID=1271 RepID=UPI002A915BA0|nr:Sec-independent protein translocase subunit TatA [Micrococcus sp.]MDY6055407.1 Sec-independent protein translocase subunit TatA [Micrococcus sp.]